jgi:tetratricopeptide (TPR) repeat protein
MDFAGHKIRVERTLLFVLFAVPLVLSPSSYNLIYIKEILFTAGAAATAFFFLASKPDKISLISLMPVLFLIWMALSAALGKYGFAGLPVIIRFVALSAVFAAVANTQDLDRSFVTKSVAASAVLPVIIGIIQMFHPGFMRGFMVFGSRVPSTFGNPNFFGAYLAAVIPVIIKTAIEIKKPLKWAAYTLAALSAVCVIMTGSKASYLAMFIEACIGLYLLLKGNEKTAPRSGIITASAAALFVLFLPAVFNVPYNNVFDGKEWMKNDSVFFRYYTWAGTVKMTGNRPMLGSGPGSFYLDFPSYKPAEIMKWSGEHSYEISQPENIFLQAAAETGIPGLLILLGSIWAVAACYKKENLPYYTGLAGLLTVNLFGVDSNYMPSLMLFFIYGGVAVNGWDGKRFGIKNITVFAAAIVTGAVLICGIAVQSMVHVSDVYLKAAIDRSEARDWDSAFSLYSSSLKADKYNVTADYFLANAYQDAALPGWEENALKQYAAVEALAPEYVLLHYKKAAILSRMGRIDEAITEYNRMLMTDPYLKPALTELAFIYYNRHDIDAAEKCLEKAVEKYGGDASLYNNLGNIYFMAKKPEMSVSAYKKAIEINPNKDYYYNLGCVYLTLNDIKNAKMSIDKASEMDAKDPKIVRMKRILNNKH